MDEASFDPAFGIRVSNPKVTLDTLNTFCSGMAKLRLGNLNPARLQQQHGEGEWVTMGVLVERTGCRKSANGNEYVIWRLSDLTELNAVTVKVLLFGDCVQQYWKLQPGNTILLNNPQVGEPNGSGGDTHKKEVTLKLSRAGQVIEIGFCPDFGRCQGRKAADGEQCSHFVNQSRSLYCPFHLQQRARQVAAHRGTLNRSANLPPKKWRQTGVPARERAAEEEKPPPGVKTLSRPKGVAQGKIYTKPVSMLQRGLNSSTSSALTSQAEFEKRSQQIDRLIADNPHNLGSKYLRVMRHQQEKENNNLMGPRAKAERPSPSGASQQSVRSMREFIHSQVIKASPSSTPPPPPPATPTQMNSAQLRERLKIERAAQILKRTKVGGEEGGGTKKRQKLEEKGEEEEPGAAPLLGASFSADQIRALLAKKSTHEGEAKEEELARQNAYFGRRELEEQVETNAASLMEIRACRVLTCKQCDYTSLHQSAYCRLQGHQVHRRKADKRFFKCMDCQRRTVSYERMPTQPCLGCKSTRFCRVAMRDERNVRLEAEQLKVREEEHSFSTTAEGR